MRPISVSTVWEVIICILIDHILRVQEGTLRRAYVYPNFSRCCQIFIRSLLNSQFIFLQFLQWRLHLKFTKPVLFWLNHCHLCYMAECIRLLVLHIIRSWGRGIKPHPFHMQRRRGDQRCSCKAGLLRGGKHNSHHITDIPCDCCHNDSRHNCTNSAKSRTPEFFNDALLQTAPHIDQTSFQSLRLHCRAHVSDKRDPAASYPPRCTR